jgi:hypothetical protein
MRNWKAFESTIQARSYVNYLGELNIVVRMHFDAFLANTREVKTFKFRHDHKVSLSSLGFEKDSPAMRNWVKEHIARIKKAFRKKLGEIYEKMEIKGHIVEFWIEEGEVKDKHLGEGYHKLAEIIPSRG